MTLYLARKVGTDHVVDETSTVYLAVCDGDGCSYMADHRSAEIATDALDGHRHREHASAADRAAGWLTFTGPGAGAMNVASGTVTPNPHMPSPTPRSQEPS